MLSKIKKVLSDNKKTLDIILEDTAEFVFWTVVVLACLKYLGS